MRKSHIVVSILTFLGLAAVIGTHVLASCFVAMGIVASYGAGARILLRPRVGRSVVATLISMTLALAAIASGAALVYLWSLLLAFPFPASLAIWSAIFGGGAAWALLATWLEEHGKKLKTLRAIHS